MSACYSLRDVVHALCIAALVLVAGCDHDITGPHYHCTLQSDTSYLWWTWTSATGETKETVSRVITGPRKVCR